MLPRSARTLFVCFIFFFNDPATTEIYTLSLHDALPISRGREAFLDDPAPIARVLVEVLGDRSEEHTSELQSHSDLVCRLLLEKKKKQSSHTTSDRPKPRWCSSQRWPRGRSTASRS